MNVDEKVIDSEEKQKPKKWVPKSIGKGYFSDINIDAIRIGTKKATEKLFNCYGHTSCYEILIDPQNYLKS